MRQDPLKVRGAIALLSRAIVHLGRGHRVDEWGDGRYLDSAIESADRLLTKALWEAKAEMGKF